jgi:hypothetical protein
VKPQPAVNLHVRTGPYEDRLRCLDIAATLHWCGEAVTVEAVQEQFRREVRRSPDLGDVRAAVAKHNTKEA